MKKCPACEKTFDDAMRFCQVDGTPLVDDDPPLDPYKTMVGRPEDFAAAIPREPQEPPKPEQPPAKEEEVLQIPESDPLKTMYASEDEIRSAMAEVDKPVIDLPPAAEPDPPAFIEPDLPTHDAGGIPDAGPPRTSPGIPSPFGQMSAYNMAPPQFDAPEPEPPSFVQPEPPSPAIDPFANQPEANAPLQQADLTPSPAAPIDRQDAQMQNPQYQPGSGLPAAASQSKMLAIVSLIIGFLGLTLCCGTILPSLVAIVLGFMARGKASSDPMNYGGGGLAMGGIITGVLGLVASIAWLVFVFLLGGMELIMREMPR